MEKHTMSFDYFDLTVEVSDDGDIEVEFTAVEAGAGRLRMPWDTFREVIDFTARHGMGINQPYVVEYNDTREAIEA